MLFPDRLEPGDMCAWPVDRLSLLEPRKGISRRHDRLYAVDRVAQILVEAANLDNTDSRQVMLEQQVEVVRMSSNQVRSPNAHPLAEVVLHDEWRQIAKVRPGDSPPIRRPDVRVFIDCEPQLHARQHVSVGVI